MPFTLPSLVGAFLILSLGLSTASAEPAAQPAPAGAMLPAEPAPDAGQPVVPKSAVRLDQAAWNPLSLVVRDQNLAEAALGPDVKLTILPVEDTARVLAGLAAGSIDIGSLSSVAAVAARANGLKIRVIGSFGRTAWSAVLARPDSTASGIDDLKGRKIAVRGPEARQRLDQALVAAGLNEGDLTLVPLHRLGARLALDRGQVDYWMADDPDRAAAELESGDKPVALTDGAETAGVLVAREAFLKAHADLVPPVLASYGKARDWAKSHPTELAKLVAAAASISPASAARALGRTDLAPLADADLKAILAADADALKATSRLPTETDDAALIGDLTAP